MYFESLVVALMRKIYKFINKKELNIPINPSLKGIALTSAPRANKLSLEFLQSLGASITTDSFRSFIAFSI
ncbi:hypothetical protein VCHA54P500_80172 [Vibrio chagasii]|nr:hypothetical protein VCHA48P439_80029 [Vibrio chagasii]CAH7412372.1 hypothetical protein VCHA54P500_80172 [Vibrio chagasii]CAH7475976.1 hypothetical protein VCHA53O462_80029 [Vibrio chagasii]